MDMATLFAQEKEQFASEIRKEKSPERCLSVLEKTWDRLQLRYVENCEEDRERELAVHLVQAAKAASGWINVSGEATIWERSAGTGEAVPVSKKISPAGVGMILGALLLIAAAGILMFAKTPEVLFQNSAGKAGGALFFAGVVLLFLAGLFIRKKPKAVKKEQKADVPVDPDRCYAAMLAVCTVIDHEISSADTEERMRKRKQAEAESRLIPEEESELYSGLLEAAYSRDGEYALEKIGDLAFYLHKKGFSVVDFDDDHKAWFDFMPGEHTSTIRPAIAKDGVLVRKGLVSYGD